MNFKFFQIKLKSYKTEYKDKLKFLDSNNGVTMYSLEPLEKKKLFGYFINSIKLYFHKFLISVSYSLEISEDEYPDLIDCISLVKGQNPTMVNKDENTHLKWVSQYEILYCLPDIEKGKIQLYHTLKEYNIME